MYTEIIEKVNKKYPSHLHDQTFIDGDLGGCNVWGDPSTELPQTWKYLMDNFNLKSVIDVGCGFGYHARTFQDIGYEVLGIEGSEKVSELSFSGVEVKHHDYKTGPYIPDKIYDLCWSIEFVEHVDSQYENNFIETFKKCRYLVMTHGTPGQGGHHHVNEQHKEYWVNLLKQHGFELLEKDTMVLRAISQKDNEEFQNCNVDKLGKCGKMWCSDVSDLKSRNHIYWFSKNGLMFKNVGLPE